VIVVGMRGNDQIEVGDSHFCEAASQIRAVAAIDQGEPILGSLNEDGVALADVEESETDLGLCIALWIRRRDASDYEGRVSSDRMG
jgi:hypothetical protein